MSDLEKYLDLILGFGLIPQVERIGTVTCVSIHVGDEHKATVTGSDAGSFTEFVFNSDGKFLSMGLWN